CALFDSLVCDRPIRVGSRTIRELQTDRSLVNVLICRVPRRISIPHQLANLARSSDLVVCGSLAVLPHLPNLVNAQHARVVVYKNFINTFTATAWGEMFVEQLHTIWF